ncbi:MAG: hypothetical protein P4M11_03545 [Candidatus Pacebacteria bacterium]|nr:hypothetical protein [Candidatus Paceibacterota bacterium]
MDEYLVKLLEIEPPDYRPQQDPDQLVVSSICMSAEGINFIVGALDRRNTELERVCHMCGIFLSQIKHYVSAKDRTRPTFEPRLFDPVPRSQTSAKLDAAAAKPEDEVKTPDDGQHYILFQDVYVREAAKRLEFLPDSFQLNLQRLLKSVDLTSYYTNGTMNLERPKDEFYEFLQQVINQPKSFLVPDEQVFKVQLLASQLANGLSTEDDTSETLRHLISLYSKEVEICSARNKQVEKLLRIVTRAATTRLNFVLDRRNFCRASIITGIFAKKFIERAKVPFEVCTNLPQTGSEEKTHGAGPGTPQPSYLEENIGYIGNP